jgi:P-type Ca2+ transporter type 2C
VCGDLIVLSEGDRVSADAHIIQATGVTADESLLTGEAVPVQKHVSLSLGKADADTAYRSSVFSGTLIVGGTALAVVDATGPRSEIGKMADR